MNTERPLDQVSSIKTKLGLLVGASVIVTAVFALIGDRAGVPVWVTVPVTLGVTLALTYWLARGMTAPLREMTDAATAMAGGDYSRTVTTTSTDEVGALARAFTTMAHDLAVTDQQRRELISTVSHELRTPLAAQRAVLENLVDGITPPSEETLSVALTQTERLSDLVEDLLDLSRLESGTTRLDLTEIDVAELIDRATREAHLTSRDITFAVTTSPGMRVLGDRSRLAQVLANLLDNAARHSPAGGTVTISAASVPASGGGGGVSDRWSLDVIDEGPGIDPAVAGRIFDRFSTGSEHSGGTGLGLAIARWICSLHGGTIELVPSTVGAHLRVTLPARPGASPLPAHQSISPTTLPQEHVVTTPVPPAASSPVPPATPAAVVQAEPAPQPQAWNAPGTAPRTGPVSPGAERLWPERVTTPQPLVLLGSLGVGTVAALLAFERRLGLIAFVVLLLGGLLVWRSSAHRLSRLTLVSAALAVLLGTSLVWRAAEWLGVISVLVGGVVAATALTRATKFSAIVASVAAWPLSGLRGLPLLGRTITATSKHGFLWPVLRTAAISLLALVLFGGLFASADAIFGSWANAVVPDLRWDSIIGRGFLLFLVSGVTLAGAYLALNPPKVDEVLPPAARRVRLWEWAVPVGLVIALFAGFLLAQANATIRGHDYIQAQAGMSYAEYVHQGFGQLTFATVLMLAVVGLTLRKAEISVQRDRLMVRLLLGALCVLTLGVVASALWRMHLYQQAYGFTSMRLFVDGFELWLGLIVIGVLVSLRSLSTRWLGRAAVLSAASLLIGLAVMNPDAWVARHNIDRFQASGQLDARYLASLSDDAAPTIARSALPTDLKACVLHVDPYSYLVSSADSGDTAEADDWLELNLGRQRAIDARAEVAAPTQPATCEEFYAGDIRG